MDTMAEMTAKAMSFNDADDWQFLVREGNAFDAVKMLVDDGDFDNWSAWIIVQAYRELHDILERGARIEAIRKVREMCGWGLQKSKDWVDAYYILRSESEDISGDAVDDGTTPSLTVLFDTSDPSFKIGVTPTADGRFVVQEMRTIGECDSWLRVAELMAARI